MAHETIKTPLETAKEQYDVAMKKANSALIANPVDITGYAAAMTELDAAEKDYEKNVASAMYDEYAKKDNPIIEIIKAYSYVTIGHKEKRDKNEKNRIISIEPIERHKTIDLLAFCKHAKLDDEWQYTASRFNQLMCLRVAKELGADYKQIAKSYYLESKAKALAMGETPTSNTQVCKLLQRVIDEMLPNEDDDGKPIYKCNNYDVRYLDALYAKKDSKKLLTVKVSRDNLLRRFLLDVAYRLVTNGQYGVDGFKVVQA